MCQKSYAIQLMYSAPRQIKTQRLRNVRHRTSVLSGKVAKLKRKARKYDQSYKTIHFALMDYLNEQPTQNQQLQINGGLLGLRTAINEMSAAMADVSVRTVSSNIKEKESKEEEGEDEEEATEEDETTQKR
ncbi:hypothetical protein N7457_007141 [Penicillium paradoxum]|uniref:uncharacterized protein n=1 Tax=Penicillium paradoxum TaxID=176176 RepID=UPI002549B8DD|nr:uncharacterized protein N7457_007141 [Penicillium paradoxum]KAJ5779421.1 hypothetical protein N7457_007141 [Penicillium paradoxum]